VPVSRKFLSTVHYGNSGDLRSDLRRTPIARELGTACQSPWCVAFLDEPQGTSLPRRADAGESRPEQHELRRVCRALPRAAAGRCSVEGIRGGPGQNDHPVRADSSIGSLLLVPLADLIGESLALPAQRKERLARPTPARFERARTPVRAQFCQLRTTPHPAQRRCNRVGSSGDRAATRSARACSSASLSASAVSDTVTVMLTSARPGGFSTLRHSAETLTSSGSPWARRRWRADHARSDAIEAMKDRLESGRAGARGWVRQARADGRGYLPGGRHLVLGSRRDHRARRRRLAHAEPVRSAVRPQRPQRGVSWASALT